MCMKKKDDFTSFQLQNIPASTWFEYDGLCSVSLDDIDIKQRKQPFYM